MRPRDYRITMLLVATACQQIVEKMTDFVDSNGKTEPDFHALSRAIGLMAEEERLREHEGLVWNKLFQWAIRYSKKAVPQEQDFRQLLNCRVSFKIRKTAAQKLIEFFSSVVAKALWYFEQPPDFDNIIANEVVKDLRRLKLPGPRPREKEMAKWKRPRAR